jgi:hypothetical protein
LLGMLTLPPFTSWIAHSQSIANKYFRLDGDHPWQEVPFRKYFWWGADESEMKLLTAIHTKFWADHQPEHVRGGRWQGRWRGWMVIGWQRRRRPRGRWRRYRQPEEALEGCRIVDDADCGCHVVAETSWNIGNRMTVCHSCDVDFSVLPRPTLRIKTT